MDAWHNEGSRGAHLANPRYCTAALYVMEGLRGLLRGKIYGALRRTPAPALHLRCTCSSPPFPKLHLANPRYCTAALYVTEGSRGLLRGKIYAGVQGDLCTTGTLPEQMSDIAWEAPVRLRKRYRRLSAKGKRAGST